METPTEHGAAPDAAPDAPAGSPARVLPEVRQRWRVTFARSGADETSALVGRDYIALWESALAGSGLPVASSENGRLRFALGAPLPGRVSARAELADIWLTERLPAWRVREGLAGVMPAAHEIVALEDVWLGAPALAGRVAAADYLVTIRTDADPAEIAAAAERLLAARQLTRERAKGGGTRTYDLRPLLASIGIDDHGTGGGRDRILLSIRTRIHPELGSGRPDEVVAALAEELGTSMEPLETTRERLVLGEDLER